MKGQKAYMEMKYPGIGYVGANQLAGLYGMSGGIVDAKGTGLQHLFYKNYQDDLIHSACTMVMVDNHLYYGNKKEHPMNRQVHIEPYISEIQDGYLYHDGFEVENNTIKKDDYIVGCDDNKIVFHTEIQNMQEHAITISLFAYANLNPIGSIHAKSNKDETIADILSYRVRMIADGCVDGFVVKDAPTGFLYRTTQSVMRDEIKQKSLNVQALSLSMMREKTVVIESGETYTFTWLLVLEEQEEEKELINSNIAYYMSIARKEWLDWFEKGYLNQLMDEPFYNHARHNLMALKACLLNGFVPADLTGHYFAAGMPCYYARDAMMIARGFLSAGYFSEFKEILLYLIERERKENGEFYQRYNGLGLPDEGANNNIFHQLDSIGFFLYNIRKYFDMTGERLVSYEVMISLFTVLESANKKRGLIGIEGGVNEGVYGGAYITSSNAFIYGGLNALFKFVIEERDFQMEQRCTRLMKGIEQGIESTYMEEEGRYAYGYVDYSDTLVKKYDTPLYFGTIYGWENREQMLSTHNYYQKYASYFGEGIGYSEQEYHHGPWLFNTMASAQYCSMIGDQTGYQKKMLWAMAHSNAYGLMPEAIDGNDEASCFINPLTWACSEFVSAAFIGAEKDDLLTESGDEKGLLV